MSSDNEEPIIFHRNIKSSVLDDDKDLDTSIEDPDIISLSGVNIEAPEFSESMYDNDLAFQIQQNSVLKSSPKPQPVKNASSWTELVIEGEQRTETTSPVKQSVSSWTQVTESESVSFESDNRNQDNESLPDLEELNINEALRNMENELLSSQGFSCEKHEKESTSETDKKKSTTWEKIDVGDRKMNTMLRKEIRRDEEREIAQNILSPRAPVLVPPGFDPTNIGKIISHNQLY